MFQMKSYFFYVLSLQPSKIPSCLQFSSLKGYLLVRILTHIVVQMLSSVCLFVTPMDMHARLPCPSPFTQTHVHWVGDAIQPSHPLLSPSPPPFNLSQHQDLFQWVTCLHQVVKLLELQLHKDWIFISPSNEYSGLISFRIDWLDLLTAKGLSRVFNTTVQKHQFIGAQLSLWSNSHFHAWLLEKP